MGGVGKTLLTAAVVRDERVRAFFSHVVWLALSQQPDISDLQQRGFTQLTGKTIPQEARETTETQRLQLKTAAKGRCLLLVLDDMYVQSHCRQIFMWLLPYFAGGIRPTKRLLYA